MRGYYTPEKRFEILEKAKTSPAYRDLAALDRLNWQDAHPILSMFSKPPVRKPDGWDEQVAADAERRKKQEELWAEIDADLAKDFKETDIPQMQEKLQAMQALTASYQTKSRT
jgi:hypothetical protein